MTHIKNIVYVKGLLLNAMIHQNIDRNKPITKFTSGEKAIKYKEITGKHKISFFSFQYFYLLLLYDVINISFHNFCVYNIKFFIPFSFFIQ